LKSNISIKTISS